MSDKPTAAIAPNAPDAQVVALRAMIRSARGAFEKPLRIERADGRLRLALEGETGAASAAGAVMSPHHQLALMRADLKSLLDHHAGTRAALRHLGAVEYELGKRGMRVFDELPLPVLRRAAGQLNGLADENGLEGVVLLQARLDMCIVDREERAVAAAPARRAAPPSLLVDDKLQVNEVSMSDFLRIAGPVEPFQTKPS